MRTNIEGFGKIAHGLSGAGTITPGMVEKRAKELAVINGRETYNQDDFRQAKLELMGMEGTIDEENVEAMESSSDFLNSATDSGKRTPAVRAVDPQTQIEELVQGGVDEAEHDTMLKGARSSVNQE